ncbi:retrovirus-related pol polyprotein from transposon TNT 1-94 [Tanacetum coccineum]
MKAVFNQTKTEVSKCPIDKKYFDIEKKELSLDNDRLLEHIICQDVMNTIMHVNDHSDNVLPANNNSLEHDNFALELLKHENSHLMELLIYQDLMHTAVNSLASINDYKSKEQSFLDDYEVNLKLQTELDKKNDMIEKNNRDAHVDYLKVNQEHTDMFRVIVEQSRALKPLGNALDYACKYVKRIQEFLVCVCASCPSSKYVGEKLVVVTPMNNTRKVRFAEPCETSKDNTYKQVNTQEKHTINNYVSPSKRVSSSTKASRSTHKSNTKKDMITQTSNSNKRTNKVEDQPRIAKSSLNNLNHVSKIICNANIKHSMLNANSKLICATCNECMFDSIYDLCVHDYLVNVNAHVKFQFVKSRNAKNKKKKMWKPTGKVYTNVRYRWKPTGRIFTIDGNTCPLTRIISTKLVPPRKSISTTLVKQTQPSCNKSRNLKDITNVGSSSKSKIAVQIILWYLDSGCSKHMTGQCSQLINFISIFLGTDRFVNDQIAKIMGYGNYQLRNVIISRVYYVDGLGYNLFSMVQFCDSDLEVAFRKHMCYVQNLDGANLISGSRDKNLYTISLDDMLKSSPICYPTNDSEDLGKLKPKAGIGIFVRYAPAKKAFRIYNKRTWQIMETIHVMFDELTAMASDQFSSGPAPQLMTLGTLCLGLMPNRLSSTPYVPPTKNN